ncbi:hypothetical protein IPM09_03100 [Candidatus Saccharibacteria bacterium]|nr:MAG: hypothetical protein IPM09_03100 [Candidatus Saccharibacteria bacterium]
MNDESEIAQVESWQRLLATPKKGWQRLVRQLMGACMGLLVVFMVIVVPASFIAGSWLMITVSIVAMLLLVVVLYQGMRYELRYTLYVDAQRHAANFGPEGLTLDQVIEQLRQQ